jgi:hypothetical protein
VILGQKAVLVRLAVVVLAGGIVACGSDGGSDGGGGSGGASGDAGSGSGGSSGAADGGSGSTVSCTITQTRTGFVPAVIKSCIETSGLLSAPDVEYLRTGCMTPVGDAGSSVKQQFELGPCSRDHAVGGCSTPSGTGLVTTRWWYDDGLQTANDVRALCQGLGDTFVAP